MNNGIPTRIDEELKSILKSIAKENQISIRMASKVAAKALNDKKNKKEKIINEIRF